MDKQTHTGKDPENKWLRWIKIHPTIPPIQINIEHIKEDPHQRKEWPATPPIPETFEEWLSIWNIELPTEPHNEETRKHNKIQTLLEQTKRENTKIGRLLRTQRANEETTRQKEGDNNEERYQQNTQEVEEIPNTLDWDATDIPCTVEEVPCTICKTACRAKNQIHI